MHQKLYGLAKLVNAQQDFSEPIVWLAQPQDFGIQHQINVLVKVLLSGTDQTAVALNLTS
jgi:hypothetical protein